MSSNGQAIRQNTAVDIPLQIALPHFIQDDKATNDGPLFGNFKLVLQSMVCHRGNSVHAGHYISIIRGLPKTTQRDSSPPSQENPNGEPPEYFEDKWIKLDDLASERVTYVDIEQALVKEMPYLLFYQVQPLFEEEPQPVGMPPPYEAPEISVAVQLASPTDDAAEIGYFNRKNNASEDWTPSRVSFSDDVERPRKSLNLADSQRRSSMATDTSGGSMPVTPGEDATVGDTPTQGRISRAASRFSRSSKSRSRPTSRVDEGRISSTFSRLNLMRGKEALSKPVDIPNVVSSGISGAVSVPDVTIVNSATTEIVETVGHTISISTQPVEEDDTSQSATQFRKIKYSGKVVDGHEHQHHHHHHHGSKGGNSPTGEKTSRPERECSLM